ncbi:MULTISPECIES: hypothetical protein [Streptomycetaceae]|uniref:hypothetical protein n=1 Tax=Streptomycetaceae TaxID=2062 RepID=UPI000214017E|nr:MULTISPECIES: hypothetical protein [Streptomycetaceae]MYS62495.1 hypothetical protein [Streptomyces sp. SID5468]CCB78417.1 exported protein of unknown function [Streptantibioticus cattleyicolor NRRL 8057 = DSM 46488]
MTIGLLSTIAAVFYGCTVSILALTATFARRPTLRREARATLAVLVPGREAESSTVDRAAPRASHCAASTAPPASLTPFSPSS